MSTLPLTDTIHPNVSFSSGTLLAKKLKQSWVEAQKIKSQWKAQKRKEGIATKSSQIEELVADHQENDAAPELSDEAESEEEVSHERRGTTLSTAFEESSEHKEGPTADIVDDAMESGSSVRHTGSSPSKRQQQMLPDYIMTHPPSLRDLQRQAYSQSSLHTFKSGHRGSDTRRGSQTATGRGRGRGSAASSQRGRGHARGRGRGQPDMRLRMNAMLEKIKRDYT